MSENRSDSFSELAQLPSREASAMLNNEAPTSLIH
jgi:hypothetical protein